MSSHGLECDIELPMKKSEFNMNSFLSSRGITRNGLPFQMQIEEGRLKAESSVTVEKKSLPLKIDKMIDPKRKTIHVIEPLDEASDSDSDDVLEIVDYKKPSLSPRVKPTKQAELLEIIQKQAKIRRQQDEDYKTFLIEKQKRKKMAKKTAQMEDSIENVNEILPVNAFNLDNDVI